MPNVFLIGPMGSGKTAVGRQLAKALGFEFHDADVAIERRTGVNIPYIFEKEGEAGFRERERDVIADLTAHDNVVIATGGGAVLLPENREKLANRGTVIYLKTSVAQQLERTRHSKQRPLLNTDDPEAKLRSLMEYRAPLYESIADITVTTDGQRVAAVCEQILIQMRKQQPSSDGQISGQDSSQISGQASGHDMQRLTIDLGERSYPICIGTGLLDDSALLGETFAARDIFVVTNERVGPLYLQRLLASLPGKRTAFISLPDGEAHKTYATLGTIFDALVAARMNRDAMIAALGGGVVGDMAGFAAACYQRGIDYVQIPTTLLAQVDSSVGGKTAVDHPGGKNLIGAFHQPRAVIADISTLSTLPDRELSAGLAEVVKYGFIRDAEFLDWIEGNATALLAREPQALAYAIRRSCEIKAEVVGIDEKEHGLRAILNFGHTFGHAIETATGYGEYLHGEAVAIGMVLALDMSRRLGWIDASNYERAVSIVENLGLPVVAPRIGSHRALELMGMDKKVRDGKIRLVLLKTLGEACVVADYPQAALSETLTHAIDSDR
jgi:shikimate kinase / 3-dehydroquinate synthase